MKATGSRVDGPSASASQSSGGSERRQQPEAGLDHAEPHRRRDRGQSEQIGGEAGDGYRIEVVSQERRRGQRGGERDRGALGEAAGERGAERGQAGLEGG